MEFMRIAISTATVNKIEKDGLGCHIGKLLTNLQRIDKSNEYYLFLPTFHKDIFKITGSNSFRIKKISLGKLLMNPIVNLFWHMVVYPIRVKLVSANVLHLPEYRRIPLFKPCSIVLTIHDMATYRIINKYDKFRMFYHKTVLPFLLRKVDKIITVSENSKADIIRFLNVPKEKVTVIYNGVDTDFFPRNRSVCRERLGKYTLPEEFILYVARLEHPGKNHVRLLQAFKKLKENTHLPHKLVLAGARSFRHTVIFETIKKLQLEKVVFFTGYFPDEDLPLLYNLADLFVFPSLYEGFGIPVLEAMASGVPVVASNKSSIPEVVGEAGVLFDPLNAHDIADSMIRVLTDTGLYKSMIEKGFKQVKSFSWMKMAISTLEIYKETARLKTFCVKKSC
jgi:glycosyltransferase involved in cell wall biosynthesis